MGLFKQMKDMKQMVESAPHMITEAQSLGAQARQVQTAEQRQPAHSISGSAAAGWSREGDFEAIAGVSLETYATISKGLATYNYDQSRAVEVALNHGVNEASWNEAVAGWNSRMQTNRAVSRRFNALYAGRA